MKKSLFYILFLLIAVWIGGFLFFAYKINHLKMTGNESKADAIIVLTGGKNRIREGAKMLSRNMADKMFISGVSKDVSINNVLRKNDIPLEIGEKIELGKAAHTTVENAMETREWIIENRIKSIYLVTSNYHTPRSLAEFEEYNPDIKIYSAPVFSDSVARKWWSKLDTFKLIFSEYNKFLFVKANHFIYKFIGD